MKGTADFFISDKIKIYSIEIENKIIIEKENGEKNEISEGLWYPRGLDYFEDKIYVADSYHNAIKVFSADGKLEKSFGMDILKEPNGVKIVDSKIYVCDKDNGYVRVFTIDGIFEKDFSVKSGYPLTIDYADGYFYVSNPPKGIEVFDRDGGFIKLIGGGKYPVSCAVINNEIYAADEFEKRILRISQENIILDTIKENEYYSIIKRFNGQIYVYNDRTGEISGFAPAEPVVDIEGFLKEQNRLSVLAYYLVGKDNEKARAYFSDKAIWDKSRDSENRIMTEVIDNKEFFEFVGKYTFDKEIIADKIDDKEKYMMKEIDTIRQVSNDPVKRPRGLFVENNTLWTNYIIHKLLVNIDENKNVTKFYKFEGMVEKSVLLNNKFFLLSYFNRKIHILDRKADAVTGTVGEKIFEKVSDIKAFNGRLYVLDSYKKKVFVFTSDGKYFTEYNIAGEEPISLTYDGKNFYLLDKRTGNVIHYNSDFKYQKTISTDAVYAEDFACDMNGSFFIADTLKSRILKYTIDGEFVFEQGGFKAPYNIVYDNKKLYISNFNDDSIKIFKVRE